MSESYQTLLDAEDIFQLLRGKVLYRESTGARATPPNGDKFKRTHAMEIAINEASMEAIRNYLSPELKALSSEGSD